MVAESLCLLSSAVAELMAAADPLARAAEPQAVLQQGDNYDTKHEVVRTKFPNGTSGLDVSKYCGAASRYFGAIRR